MVEELYRLFRVEDSANHQVWIDGANREAFMRAAIKWAKQRLSAFFFSDSQGCDGGYCVHESALDLQSPLLVRVDAFTLATELTWSFSLVLRKYVLAGCLELNLWLSHLSSACWHAESTRLIGYILARTGYLSKQAARRKCRHVIILSVKGVILIGRLLILMVLFIDNKPNSTEYSKKMFA